MSETLSNRLKSDPIVTALLCLSLVCILVLTGGVLYGMWEIFQEGRIQDTQEQGEQEMYTTSDHGVALGYDAVCTDQRILPGAVCDCGCGLTFDECLKTKHRHLPLELEKEVIKTRIFSIFRLLPEQELDALAERVIKSRDGQNVEQQKEQGDD